MNSTVFFNKLTALLLLVTVAGSTFNKGIALLDYRLNGNFIANHLCENRDKPLSCCHGKCFLKKQMQKDDSEKSGPASSRESLEIVWFFEEGSADPIALVNSEPVADHYILKYYHTSLPSLFHPPAGYRMV